ncbi:MAG: hypothetical protein M3O82_06630 [Verrucomicrobiota bacterium]|nr:hypothetical protein [Verrucomicrobiota bacterium]
MPPKKKTPAKPAARTLPMGICLTRFFNPEHRAQKLARHARPCFYAYIGGKGSYKAKRFMIDVLGREKALKLATKWRRERERETGAASPKKPAAPKRAAAKKR